MSRRLPLSVCLLIVLAGCPPTQPDPSSSPGASSLKGTTLRLAIVDDPPLAVAIGVLQGEWQAQTGGDFELVSLSEDEWLAAETLDADAVICRSPSLGVLAEKGTIQPVPETIKPQKLGREGENSWSGVFELLRLREAAFGGKLYGVPFGSPVLFCYYRADLLEQLGRRPPETWAEYQELAALLAERKPKDAPEGFSPTLEPLAPGWASLVLLARAAAYAKHPDNYSTLFDIQTMEPRIAGPPFVRALEELVATAELAGVRQLDATPADVRAAFWRGECGMALTWPSSAAEGLPEKVSEDIQVGFAELPGSKAVFHPRFQQWETRHEGEDIHVPLLGIAGRIGVVSAASRQPQAAFQLLGWLAGEQFGSQACPESAATTMFRNAHTSFPTKWTESPVSPASAADFGTVAEAAFSRQQYLMALRIPGRSEYLATLDEAVRDAVGGRKSPAEALRAAAEKWRTVTEKLGMENQKQAYRHSLGLE